MLNAMDKVYHVISQSNLIIEIFSLVKETRPVLTEDRRSFDRHQYPSMDYTGLYKALGKIVNVVPVVEIGVEGKFHFDVTVKLKVWI